MGGECYIVQGDRLHLVREADRAHLPPPGDNVAYRCVTSGVYHAQPGRGAFTCEERDADICRICREEDGGRLVVACNCTGSIRFAHRQCLLQWVVRQRTVVCELCDTTFRISRLYARDAPPLVAWASLLLDQAAHLARAAGRRIAVGLFLVSVWVVAIPLLLQLALVAALQLPTPHATPQLLVDGVLLMYVSLLLLFVRSRMESFVLANKTRLKPLAPHHRSLAEAQARQEALLLSPPQEGQGSSSAPASAATATPQPPAAAAGGHVEEAPSSENSGGGEDTSGNEASPVGSEAGQSPAHALRQPGCRTRKGSGGGREGEKGEAPAGVCLKKADNSSERNSPTSQAQQKGVQNQQAGQGGAADSLWVFSQHDPAAVRLIFATFQLGFYYDRLMALCGNEYSPSGKDRLKTLFLVKKATVDMDGKRVAMCCLSVKNKKRRGTAATHSSSTTSSDSEDSCVSRETVAYSTAAESSSSDSDGAPPRCPPARLQRRRLRQATRKLLAAEAGGYLGWGAAEGGDEGSAGEADTEDEDGCRGGAGQDGAVVQPTAEDDLRCIGDAKNAVYYIPDCLLQPHCVRRLLAGRKAAARHRAAHGLPAESPAEGDAEKGAYGRLCRRVDSMLAFHADFRGAVEQLPHSLVQAGPTAVAAAEAAAPTPWWAFGVPHTQEELLLTKDTVGVVAGALEQKRLRNEEGLIGFDGRLAREALQQQQQEREEGAQQHAHFADADGLLDEGDVLQDAVTPSAILSAVLAILWQLLYSICLPWHAATAALHAATSCGLIASPAEAIRLAGEAVFGSGYRMAGTPHPPPLGSDAESVSSTLSALHATLSELSEMHAQEDGGGAAYAAAAGAVEASYAAAAIFNSTVRNAAAAAPETLRPFAQAEMLLRVLPGAALLYLVAIPLLHTAARRCATGAAAAAPPPRLLLRCATAAEVFLASLRLEAAKALCLMWLLAHGAFELCALPLIVGSAIEALSGNLVTSDIPRAAGDPAAAADATATLVGLAQAGRAYAETAAGVLFAVASSSEDPAQLSIPVGVAQRYAGEALMPGAELLERMCPAAVYPGAAAPWPLPRTWLTGCLFLGMAVLLMDAVLAGVSHKAIVLSARLVGLEELADHDFSPFRLVQNSPFSKQLLVVAGATVSVLLLALATVRAPLRVAAAAMPSMFPIQLTSPVMLTASLFNLCIVVDRFETLRKASDAMRFALEAVAAHVGLHRLVFHGEAGLAYRDESGVEVAIADPRDPRVPQGQRYITPGVPHFALRLLTLLVATWVVFAVAGIACLALPFLLGAHLRFLHHEHSLVGNFLVGLVVVLATSNGVTYARSHGGKLIASAQAFLDSIVDGILDEPESAAAAAAAPQEGGTAADPPSTGAPSAGDGAAAPSPAAAPAAAGGGGAPQAGGTAVPRGSSGGVDMQTLAASLVAPNKGPQGARGASSSSSSSSPDTALSSEAAGIAPIVNTGGASIIPDILFTSLLSVVDSVPEDGPVGRSLLDAAKRGVPVHTTVAMTHLLVFRSGLLDTERDIFGNVTSLKLSKLRRPDQPEEPEPEDVTRDTPLSRHEAEMLQLMQIILGNPAEIFATATALTPREQLDVCLLVWAQYLRMQEQQRDKKHREAASSTLLSTVAYRGAALLRLAGPMLRLVLHWVVIVACFGVVLPMMTGALVSVVVTTTSGSQTLRLSLVHTLISGMFSFKLWVRITMEKPQCFTHAWNRHWRKMFDNGIRGADARYAVVNLGIPAFRFLATALAVPYIAHNVVLRTLAVKYEWAHLLYDRRWSHAAMLALSVLRKPQILSVFAFAVPLRWLFWSAYEDRYLCGVWLHRKKDRQKRRKPKHIPDLPYVPARVNTGGQSDPPFP